MRGMHITWVLVVLGAVGGGLFADDAPEEERVVPGTLHRPQDQAPAELVIVPRPPEEYLPPGSLLSTGVRAKRPVDLEELHRRKLSMYAGRPETRSLPSTSDAPAGPPPLVLADAPLAPGTNFGALVFWSLVSCCVVVTLWLLLRVLLALRTRTGRLH